MRTIHLIRSRIGNLLTKVECLRTWCNGNFAKNRLIKGSCIGNSDSHGCRAGKVITICGIVCCNGCRTSTIDCENTSIANANATGVVAAICHSSRRSATIAGGKIYTRKTQRRGSHIQTGRSERKGCGYFSFQRYGLCCSFSTSILGYSMSDGNLSIFRHV